MDELGPLEPIPRGGPSWGWQAQRRPNRYQRTGTVQWLAGFAPHLGIAIGNAYPRKRTTEVRHFLEQVLLPAFPDRHLYLIWDNLSSHQTQQAWLSCVKDRISVVWLPTNCPWLNLVEAYFSVLTRTALHNTNFKTTQEISKVLEKAADYLNRNPKKYKWNHI